MSAESIGIWLTAAGGGFTCGFLITNGLLGIRQITKGARGGGKS